MKTSVFGNNKSFKEFNKVLSDTVKVYQNWFDVSVCLKMKGFVPFKIGKMC